MKCPQQIIYICFILSINNCFANHKKNYKSKKDLYVPYVDKDSCVLNVCNSTSQYPEKYILKMLRKNKLEVFGKRSGTVIEPTKIIEIANRFEGGDERNMCKTRQVTILPQSAKFLGSTYMSYIVNVKGYTQALSFETCVPDSSCFPNGDILGYHTFCKQVYNNVKLLYLTRKGKLAYGKFPIPSTCLCAYNTQKLFYD